jgi:hypothetical protein
MTTKPRQPRPGQLRNDEALRSAISGAFDSVLGKRSGRLPAADRFPEVWASYSADCRRAGRRPDAAWFAGMAQEVEARAALKRTLALDDWNRRARVARQVAADRALVASLGEAAERRQAADRAVQERRRAHQLSLTPVGPIRIPIRLW